MTQNIDEAITRLMAVFRDRPQVQGGLPDVDWSRRNAFVAWIREGNEVVQKLRVNVAFLDTEFPVIINLARFWAELIYEGTYEAEILRASDVQLRALVETMPGDLEEEKRRIAPVWDDPSYFFRELYPEGDTGEWYQIVFRSLLNLNDEDLRENIGKIFELLSPLAEKELEIRDSRARWTAYGKYQVIALDSQLAEAKALAKSEFDRQVTELRGKWAEALATSKRQLLDAEVELRSLEMEKREIMRPVSRSRKPISFSLQSFYSQRQVRKES